jgi:predicted AAA+ superfamily ATPase
MYTRFIAGQIQAALQDTPAVFIAGPRQGGKSTLAKTFSDQKRTYYSLDDLSFLELLQKDPQGFIQSLTGPVTIDEVQRAPDLLLAIKYRIDQQRQPGFFLLTGSANILALPQVADSLAGRMEIHHLYPLSSQEITGQQNNWINQCFQEESVEILKSSKPTLSTEDLRYYFIRGGYPNAFEREDPDRRSHWFESYISTILQRDFADILRITDIARVRLLYELVAVRSGALLNIADLARSSGIPASTLSLYLDLFETLFIMHRIPAWYTNFTKRLTKTPKVYLNDSGLLSHFLNADLASLEGPSRLSGPIIENFIACELMKQLTWSKPGINLYHYRTHAGSEVDFILQDKRQRLMGIEVKASHTVGLNDFKALQELQAQEPAFFGGIVLYRGEHMLPFGPKLWAVPLRYVL